jgi:hypothetical protein
MILVGDCRVAVSHNIQLNRLRYDVHTKTVNQVELVDIPDHLAILQRVVFRPQKIRYLAQTMMF